MLNIKQIQKIIPHRHPFLLIDYIEDYEPGVYAVARSCLALEVRWISFPFFSIIKLLKSFSIISALVATVPSPPVSPSVFAACRSPVDRYLTGFSMAARRVASVNLTGGFVFPSFRRRVSVLSFSPCFLTGRL